MTRLVISPLAEIDIEEIGDFIANDNPDRALVSLWNYAANVRKSPYRRKPAASSVN